MTDAHDRPRLKTIKIQRIRDDINPILQSIGKEAGIAFGH
jgi:hypothetical protein